MAQTPQTLQWTSPATNTALVWGRAYPLVATSSSGLPVSFRVQGGPAGIVDGMVTATNAGAITLVAEQAGDATVAPVLLTRTFNQPIYRGESIGRWPGISGGDTQAVTVKGTRAYVADASRAFHVVDVSNPAAPTLVGSINTRFGSYGVHVEGTLAYVAAGALTIFDVGNPATPMRLGTIDTSGPALGVRVVGSIAYVAQGGSKGLQLVDVSNPVAPTSLGRISIGSDIWGVQVSGSMAYLSGVSGLSIIDVGNPAAPTLLGGISTGSVGFGLQVVGGIAYVASWTKGLQVIDVGDPAKPVRLGGYVEPGSVFVSANSVQVLGNVAYVANGVEGLQVLDVSNPAKLVRLLKFSIGSDANGVQVADDLAYLTDHKGLKVVRVMKGLAQTISFTLTTPVPVRRSPIILEAAASSGLPVTFKVVSGPGTVDGNVLSLTGPGTVVVRAEQGGNAQFLAAASVDATVSVLPDPPLRLTGASRDPEGYLRFTLEGPANTEAILQFSEDLRSWTTVSTNRTAEVIQTPRGAGEAAGFYRALSR